MDGAFFIITYIYTVRCEPYTDCVMQRGACLYNKYCGTVYLTAVLD